MQRVVSSNDDIIVEKSIKDGEKDIVNNEVASIPVEVASIPVEVASIPVKAIDVTNENNEEKIEFKENGAEELVIPEGLCFR
ncbi:hypothetical protein [Clostridium sp.]|jgi:hypothetical protein|uniref:hypothetical protein n=1 Tax=Clostridium sp. TaxID=1506 RepID=UPI0025C2ACE2|nr:hypothetical protein [Clostridium sp.]MCI9070942.1 hypothetical protein [Clostridium sp.]